MPANCIICSSTGRTTRDVNYRPVSQSHVEMTPIVTMFGKPERLKRMYNACVYTRMAVQNCTGHVAHAKAICTAFSLSGTDMWCCMRQRKLSVLTFHRPPHTVALQALPRRQQRAVRCVLSTHPAPQRLHGSAPAAESGAARVVISCQGC
jgi:hypothetical protein